jgi:5-enolpyruvylshikimate-3-phosphate synthase
MPKFIIERDIPDAGKLTTEQLQETSQKSCFILKQMGPKIQWVESYVTNNKVYCVYIAPSEQAIVDHAATLGLPATQINQVRSIIDPTTAE